jgi:hypothetical protein
MKLTDTAAQIIGNPKERDAKAIRTTLALALNFTERWVLKCIQENKDNGPLTTVKALQIIKRLTGLSQSEILEESQESARA